MIPTEILNLGALAVIFLFFLKEFFAYLKAKKNGNGNYKIELASINKKLDNHLHDVNKTIARIDRDIMKMDNKLENIGNNVLKLMIDK